MTGTEFANIVNKLRVFPRIMVLGSIIYFGFYSWEVTDWYMNLAVRTIEESAFVGSVVTLLGGIVKFMIDTYIKTGGNNDK